MQSTSLDDPSTVVKLSYLLFSFAQVNNNLYATTATNI